MEMEMEKYIGELKQLNEYYQLKLKNLVTFDDQKEIVDILEQIDCVVDKIYLLNKSAKKNHSNKLELLCEKHEWKIDRSMYDGHTSKYCIKCNKHIG